MKISTKILLSGLSIAVILSSLGATNFQSHSSTEQGDPLPNVTSASPANPIGSRQNLVTRSQTRVGGGEVNSPATANVPSQAPNPVSESRDNSQGGFAFRWLEEGEVVLDIAAKGSFSVDQVGCLNWTYKDKRDPAMPVIILASHSDESKIIETFGADYPLLGKEILVGGWSDTVAPEVMLQGQSACVKGWPRAFWLYWLPES